MFFFVKSRQLHAEEGGKHHRNVGADSAGHTHVLASFTKHGAREQ